MMRVFPGQGGMQLMSIPQPRAYQMPRQQQFAPSPYSAGGVSGGQLGPSQQQQFSTPMAYNAGGFTRPGAYNAGSVSGGQLGPSQQQQTFTPATYNSGGMQAGGGYAAGSMRPIATTPTVINGIQPVTYPQQLPSQGNQGGYTAPVVHGTPQQQIVEYLPNHPVPTQVVPTGLRGPTGSSANTIQSSGLTPAAAIANRQTFTPPQTPQQQLADVLRNRPIPTQPVTATQRGAVLPNNSIQDSGLTVGSALAARQAFNQVTPQSSGLAQFNSALPGTSGQPLGPTISNPLAGLTRTTPTPAQVQQQPRNPQTLAERYGLGGAYR